MLRRLFLKILGATPAAPSIVGGKPRERKFKTVKMAVVKVDAYSGIWPFEKGQRCQVVDAPEKYKHSSSWMVWLRHKDGKHYGISARNVDLYDRQEEIS